MWSGGKNDKKSRSSEGQVFQMWGKKSISIGSAHYGKG